MARTKDGWDLDVRQYHMLYRYGGDEVFGELSHYGSEEGWEMGSVSDIHTPVCRLYKDRSLAINERILDLHEEINKLEAKLLEIATK